jgi:predicted anti-sigma-YlaC factor YlaD
VYAELCKLDLILSQVVMDAAAELRPGKQEGLVMTCTAMWTTLAAMDKKLKKRLHLKLPTALPKLVPAIRTRSHVNSVQVSDTAQLFSL